MLQKTRIVRITRVNGGFARLEFESHFENPEKPVNAVQLLNASDPRFKSTTSARGWYNASPEDVEKNFGIAVADIMALTISTGVQRASQVEGIHYLTVNIENPTLDGHEIHLQVTETLSKPLLKDGTPDPYALEKINPTTSEVLTKNGKPIYRVVSLVVGEPKHTFIIHDKEKVSGAVTLHREITDEEEFSTQGFSETEIKEPTGMEESGNPF